MIEKSVACGGKVSSVLIKQACQDKKRGKPSRMQGQEEVDTNVGEDRRQQAVRGSGL